MRHFVQFSLLKKAQLECGNLYFGDGKLKKKKEKRSPRAFLRHSTVFLVPTQFQSPVIFNWVYTWDPIELSNQDSFFFLVYSLCCLCFSFVYYLTKLAFSHSIVVLSIVFSDFLIVSLL